MKRIILWLVKALFLAGLLFFGLLLSWAFQSRGMPELRVWHTASLPSEFTRDTATAQASPQDYRLQDYLDREEQLFRELREEVYTRVKPADDLIYSRYHAGGVQDPEAMPHNWNRTFELVPEEIRGGALLLHGLTDSPYSLRRIGEVLHAEGFYVLGLRLPGHGTIPAALTEVKWEDWVAASRIGARQVRERIGVDKPFVIAGYSNGGGLAVKYALDAISDPVLPAPDRLLLFSPEIGITPLAAIANADRLLSFLPYFAKFKWLSIQPEYDPYKYNSFPKNAAQEAHDLTIALQDQVKAMRDAGRLAAFPPVLTFISGKDATVNLRATVEDLYNEIQNGSELVIFDVNRYDRLAGFIPATYGAPLEALEARTDLPYRLSVLTNASAETDQIVQRSRAAGSDRADSLPLNLAWPKQVYSLAHVSIPFPPDDPVYGTAEVAAGAYQGIPLGALTPRGEERLLTVPLSQLMRLRYNPFFVYLERRIKIVASCLLDGAGLIGPDDPANPSADLARRCGSW